jgi:uncharacterized protein YggU (UPF0235/DUF167 family)
LDAGEVVVYSTEEPQRGKVNKEIIKEFTKIFGAQVDLVLVLRAGKNSFLVHVRF